MKFQNWALAEPNKAALATLEAAGVSPLVASVLAARGFHAPDEAKRFLSFDSERLGDPFDLRDKDRAEARVKAAMRAGEKAMCPTARPSSSATRETLSAPARRRPSTMNCSGCLLTG